MGDFHRCWQHSCTFSFLFYKIQEIGGVKIGKLVIPDLIASSQVNVVFSGNRLHFACINRLAVAHVFAEFVAFETSGKVADMANGSVNIVKQALFLQINQTERIADVFTVIINDFRVGAKLAELFLKSIALQDRTIIVVVVEGWITPTLFLFIKSSCIKVCTIVWLWKFSQTCTLVKFSKIKSFQIKMRYE